MSDIKEVVLIRRKISIMNKITWSFITVTALLLAMAVYSAVTGSLQAGPWELVQGLFTGTNEKVEIIRDLRLPRIIIAVFSGAALAVAGVLFQAVMRNPLADAGVIGISSGAGFSSLILVTLLPQWFFWSPLFAFLGGVVACALVFLLSWKSGLSPIRIILVGVAVNAMFSGLNEAFLAICSYLQTGLSAEAASYTAYISLKTWDDVRIMLVYGSLGLLASLCLSTWCNLLSLQDKTVHNLGLNVTSARLIISAVAVFLAAVTTAVAGVIAFVGLLIPHIARRLVGSDHRALIPFSALAGALLILSADTLGRTLVPPNELPSSIIMSVIGGPVLIFLLRKGGRVRGN